MNIKAIPLILASLLSFTAYCQPPLSKEDKIQSIFENHFTKYQNQEYYSGASLSTFVPKQTLKNYYLGRVSHRKDSQNISENTLFEIGSITKSFTAALILQLEKEKKLSLDDTVGKWLPQYSKWSSVTIRELLNMTSGIPNYSESPLWNTAQYNNPLRIWKDEELISFAYPPENFSPPLKKGYFYTNTGYLLASLIIDKATSDSYKNVLTNNLFKIANLNNSYYPVPKIEPELLARLSHSYSYNQYDNALMLGRDFHDESTSWAAAAGGIIATTEDIIHWVNALFVENKILDPSQKKKLKQLISLKSGKAIEDISKGDEFGFGLGVVQRYDEKFGRLWFYEGSTLGFRALYIYKECNGIIVATAFNSATNGENDHVHDLVLNVYNEIIQENPNLKCEDNHL